MGEDFSQGSNELQVATKSLFLSEIRQEIGIYGKQTEYSNNKAVEDRCMFCKEVKGQNNVNNKLASCAKG